MSLEYIALIAAILVLLVLSAFFSGSETALTGASLPRMHELARQLLLFIYLVKRVFYTLRWL